MSASRSRGPLGNDVDALGAEEAAIGGLLEPNAEDDVDDGIVCVPPPQAAKRSPTATVSARARGVIQGTIAFLRLALSMPRLDSQAALREFARMSEEAESPADAKIAEAPPSYSGTAEEAERLIAKASPTRMLMRLGGALLFIAVLGGGGLIGYRAYCVDRAKNGPMVKFEAGKAHIGNDLFDTEAPAHDVDLKAYAIDVTEVTVRDFETCFGRGGCTEPIKGDYCNWGKEDVAKHPINCVTHSQAIEYCKWVEKRLPTEKEWERAARRPDTDKAKKKLYEDQGNYPWGVDAPTPKLANVCGKECSVFGAKKGQNWPNMHEFDDGYPLTAPVGSFPEGNTSEGLKDMAGNVWEWTSSPYCEYPAEECGNQIEYVIRGGGFLSYSRRNLEVTTREAMPGKDGTHTVGFRCAKSL
jgi:formylglycine-generating enzyme